MAENGPYETQEVGLISDCDCSQNGCVKAGYHYSEISVPIELKPDTALGEVVVECCGEPDIDCCEAKSDDCCEIIVTQRVSIRIPIYYQVLACMGESKIDCDCGQHCCE